MRKFLVMGVVSVVAVVIFSQVASSLNRVFKCLAVALGGGQC